MNVVSVTHEAGDTESLQLCARCGRVIVPLLRHPFVPGHAITFQIDVDQQPPVVTNAVDSVEKLANVSWCDGAPGEWLEAFDIPDGSG